MEYLTNATGSWVESVVDNDSFSTQFPAAIAVDSNRHAHVSYFGHDPVNPGRTNRKYANNVLAEWTIHMGCMYDDSSLSPIVVGPDDKIYMSSEQSTVYGVDCTYYGDLDFCGFLRIYDNSTQTWSKKQFVRAPNYFDSLALALDSNGGSHVSYHDKVDGDLKYNGSTIDSDGDVGSYSAIAVDSSNASHILYYDTTNETLKYATNATGAWRSSTIVSVSHIYQDSLSLALDSSGAAHISYYDPGNRSLKYATNVSGTWRIMTIDSGDVGSYSSLAIGGTRGAINIVYNDDAYGRLKYATLSLCGNTIQSGGETCDDGNLTNGDGCSSTCEREYIWSNLHEMVSQANDDGGAEAHNNFGLSAVAVTDHDERTSVDSDGASAPDTTDTDAGTAIVPSTGPLTAIVIDTDSDGIPDSIDPDNDNDGVLNTDDAYPQDATRSVVSREADTDGDGTPDATDTDDDNDGVLDTADAYPADATRSVLPEVAASGGSGGCSLNSNAESNGNAGLVMLGAVLLLVKLRNLKRS